MVDNEFVKKELNKFEDIREVLQGKPKRSVWGITITIAAIISIVYFIFNDTQIANNDLMVLVLFIAIAISNITYKISFTCKRIDAIVKLLDLEKLAQNRCVEDIKEMSNKQSD